VSGRLIFTLASVLALSSLAPPAGAQGTRVYRIGVVEQGGPYSEAIEGLREGLREGGLEEGKHYALKVTDAKGVITVVESAARQLEADKVDLIFAVSSSTALAVKKATSRVPIVFYAGTDPVESGLVASFRKPGGRLTGVFGRQADVTAKRLELLKAIMPKLARVFTPYNPNNSIAVKAFASAQEAAQQLKVQLVERRVATPDELRAAVRAIKPGEVEALFYVPDAMVTSQVDMIIETAREKRLATMFTDTSTVARGALASYGISFRAVGKLAAKHVQRVLKGTPTGDIPVEQMDRLHFAINLKTANEIGLTVPHPVLMRADEVVQ
jgi:putative ABC transport system substrate-binding protein